MKSIAITIIIISVLAAVLSIYNLYQTVKVVKQTEKQEWCEVGTKNPDGSVTYNGDPGTTEIFAFATASGPKLMVKCK